MTPRVVRPVVGSDELDCDIEARITGGVVGVEAETGTIQLLHARLRRIVELVSAAIAAQASCGTNLIEELSYSRILIW
jgi:hypothetical protein